MVRTKRVDWARMPAASYGKMDAGEANRLHFALVELRGARE